MNNINYEKWFDKNAKIYSKNLNKYTILRRAEFIKAHAKGKVLDIGISDGRVTSLYIKSKKIKKVIGIDISAEMLKKCKKILKKNGKIIVITPNPSLLFLEPLSVILKLTPKEYLLYKPLFSSE